MPTKKKPTLKKIEGYDESYPTDLASLCDLLIKDTEKRGVDKIVITNDNWDITIERILPANEPTNIK